MKKGTKTYVGPSQIHGNGLFAGEDLSVNDGFFGTTHEDNWPTTDLGQNYNHSETPNARVTKIGNKHFIMPIDKIGAGEEITVDYRKQPELEQPQEGWKFGGKVYMEDGGPTDPPKQNIKNVLLNTKANLPEERTPIDIGLNHQFGGGKESNMYKYMFANPNPEGIFGLMGAGHIPSGLEGNIGAIIPYQPNKYWKGEAFGGISKNFPKFSVGLTGTYNIADGKNQKGINKIKPGIRARFNFQDGGKIKPKITFTKDQLAEYESGYTGEVPFMDQIFNEYRDMNYFPVMNEDGSLSAYEVADISEGIMQHGYRGNKLAEITGADRARIDEMFQPVYDYHQAKYDERGMRKIQEYMDMGFTKSGAFNELIKSNFGTEEGLERIFGERAEGIASRKLAAERAARDLMQRQKEQETGEETYTAPAPPLLTRTDSKTAQQLRDEAYAGGPTIEGAKLLEEADRIEREQQRDQQPNIELGYDSMPVVAESTDVTNIVDSSFDNTFDFQIKTPQQVRAEQQAFVRSAMNEYYTNRVLWEDELGLSRDDFINPETGDYDDVALVQAMYAPEMQQKKIQNFQAQEQKIWDDMPWYKKAGQQVVAFMDDPILTGSQWMQGEGAMVGQEAWLSDPEKAQQVADRYGVTTQDLYDISGDSESWINDAFKVFNPLHYATQAGVSMSDAADDFDKGEYAEGLKDLGYAGANLIGGITGASELTGASKMLGYATAKELGVNQVLRGVAKPSQLFKRKDLVRLTGKESLQELKDRIASGQFNPSDAMWQQALKNNDELAKYASQYGDNLMYQATPLTEAAASQYSLGNLMTRANKGKSLPTGITREAVEDAATKSIPSRAEMMSNPEFRKHYLSLPLNQRINVNQMVSQPQNYWQNSLLQIDNKIVNPGLKDALGRNMFNTGEYLLPRKLDEFTAIGSRSIDDISAGSLITPTLIQAEKVAAQKTATRAGSQTIAESKGEEVPVEEQPAEQQKVQSASVNTDAVQSPGERGLINYMQMQKMFGGAGFK